MQPETRSRDWEAAFSQWAQPPSQTEEQRCANAVRAIRNAISSSEKLKNRSIRVFTQGSYRNHVNVRRDSDVDVGVLCIDTFNPSYPEAIDAKRFGHADATYRYATFKDELVEALTAHFGLGTVRRGNKAIDIRENSYHVEADVVPFFEHRRYVDLTRYHSGVVLFPDRGGQLINWPEQHYENGVTKNTETSRRFKSVVRILKSLRVEMDEAGIPAARPILGFLVECLVWNLPITTFDHLTWDERLQAALLHLWSNTKNDASCTDWGEVSELKYLFRGSPPEKRQRSHAFIDAAWNYVGVR